uniref:HTH CENPB-type domain-containing protein n=1 Tax=Nothobranchius furzeri TaxID=105023 RepID=A0A8C6KRG3_NOTFU
MLNTFLPSSFLPNEDFSTKGFPSFLGFCVHAVLVSDEKTLLVFTFLSKEKLENFSFFPHYFWKPSSSKQVPQGGGSAIRLTFDLPVIDHEGNYGEHGWCGACRAEEEAKFDLKFKENVLIYAAEHSGEQAAKHFNIDPRRIRYWKKQKMGLAAASKMRARLPGGGRKKISEELDTELCNWIHLMKANHNRVSRKMIRNKALEIFPTMSDAGMRFLASRGWLEKFLNRNGFALRRRTTMAQKDPDLLTQKLVSFVDYVSKTVVSKRISEKDIIAMDETAVWFDMVSPSTINVRGTKSVALKTTGHEKSHLTVALAAKADGSKLKPFIVFRGAVREVKAMQQEITRAVIATSANGWMNDDLTSAWLKTVVGKFSFHPHLLVWDAYRCHISASTKQEMKPYNITTAVIPGGCTNLHASYEEWMSGDTNKQYTSGGNLKAPSRRLLVDWVLAAWDKLDTELVIKSFKVCGQSVKPDGSEDHLILCFRDGQVR